MTDYKTAYEDARKEFRTYMKLAESRIAEKDAMIVALIRLLAAHAFDDSDGIGECAMRVPLPGNGWYRCGLRKEDHGRMACPECGRRQISGNDHFVHCSKAGDL